MFKIGTVIIFSSRTNSEISVEKFLKWEQIWAYFEGYKHPEILHNDSRIEVVILPVKFLSNECKTKTWFLLEGCGKQCHCLRVTDEIQPKINSSHIC